MEVAVEARRAGCRAGHCSAKDLFLTGSPSVLPFVVRRRQISWLEVPTEPGFSLAVIAVQAGAGGGGYGGADRGQSSSSGSAEGWRRSSQVYVQDRVQQRRTWSRSLLFLLVEVFKVFSQARVPHRVDSFKMRMRDFKGFSHFSPAQKKSAKVTRQSSPRVPASGQLIHAGRSSNGSGRGV